MLHTLKIGARLNLGFGLMIVLLIGVGVFALYQLSVLAHLTSQLYAGPFTASNAIRDANAHLLGMHRGMKDVILAHSPAETKSAFDEIELNEKEMHECLETAIMSSPGDNKDLTEIQEGVKQWTAMHDEILALLQANKREQAVHLATEDANQQVTELEKKMEEAITQANDEAKAFKANSDATTRLTFTLTFVILGGIVLIGLVLSNVVARSITRPLQEGISVLVSAGSEIAATSTQLASSATETASSVSETTATVEEVKQTSRVATEKAQEVSERAQQTVQVSQRGEQAVDATVQGIHHIREQMVFVADSVVRLSEQSQAIGEIIASVDDLAEQSNLLAVNASIEAAKAGEQGKGFAVVAREVKSLAEQSRQATRQVRTILNDIQKATSAAVMATEQGSKAVEAGVAQSTEVGAALRTLAQSITDSAQMALQIVASSQQQYAGIDQVTLAMESIKEATSQNVGGARQLEEASRNLNELGQRLQQMIAHRRV